MSAESKIIKQLEHLLGREIEIDGYSPNSLKTKIVTVATNKKEDNFYIGVLPVDGLYESYSSEDFLNEYLDEEDWFMMLPEYGNTGVYWFDKNNVENIRELSYLKNLKIDKE